jgi:peptide/nickel transport system permease protein/oligopeptide transport system permease protein
MYGRDIFSNVIHGARISLTIAILTTVISLGIGIFLGACAGYFGGWIDSAVSWLVNVIYSFPFLLFIIAIVAYLPPSLLLTFVAIGCVSWMRFARLVRGQFLSLREKEFVEAARALGANDFAIMFKHLLPNALAPVIVEAWDPASDTKLGIYDLHRAGLHFIGTVVVGHLPRNRDLSHGARI